MKHIVIKYLEGLATDLEQHQLLDWLRLKGNRKEFNCLKSDWEQQLDKQQLPLESQDTWIKIQEKIMQKNYVKHNKYRCINYLSRIAAVVLFVIGVGSLIYLSSNQQESPEEFYTKVMAEKGQIAKMELPDGSLVWLNSGSEISYNSAFASGNRRIALKGEAYFDVERNEAIPFVVNSGELQVKVLGTKFNVSAYPEALDVEVVLEKGSVELLNTKDELFHCVLEPNERAVFSKAEKQAHVGIVNASKFTLWKEGMMNVYDQTLDELSKRLEVRYNQEFVLTDEVKDIRYTFTIQHESLDEVIKLMKKITPIKAVQKHNTIYFEKDHLKDKE